MDSSLARKMWATLEAYHAAVYFVPEAQEEYQQLGIVGWHMGYFASRAAAMGAVPADVVIATFYNFHPDVVRSAIPEAWRRASPDQIVKARLLAIDRGLRRILGDAIAGPEVAEAAALAREVCAALTPHGRPLYAGHAALAWPEAPHLALWHAITLLREWRGDGHVALLTAEGIGPAEAIITYVATGRPSMPGPVLQATRAWSDAEWAAASERLKERGWLDAAGQFTESGRAMRQRLEDRTDEMALPPWERIGEESSERLRSLVRPLSQAITQAGTFERAAAVTGS